MSNYTVLCVDDEENVLRALHRLLRKEDFRLLTANSGKEALKMMEQTDVHVVISDQRMPEMTGTQFLEQVKELYPHTIRVVLSGYADAAAILDAINHGNIYRFLTKPWNDEELKADIRQCLRQYLLIHDNCELTLKLEKQNERLKHLATNLEKAVQERSHTLQFLHELVSYIPIPIAGINCDGEIVLSNNAFQESCSALNSAFIGMNIENTMPQPLKDFIIAGINEDAQTRFSRLTVDNHVFETHLWKIQDSIFTRGCLLIMEEALCLEYA